MAINDPYGNPFGRILPKREDIANTYGKYDLSQPANSVLTSIKPKYDNQINNILSQLQQAATKNMGPINVADDPRYQAQMSLMEQNVKQGQRQTMEQMNARGLLMSDMTNDRLGQIEQEGMTGLNAIVPALYDAISNERIRDQQFEMNRLLSVLGAYQQEDQRGIDNQFKMNQLNLQERQIAFNEGLQSRNYNLALDAWVFDVDLATRQQQLNEQNNELTNAINRVNTIGFVMDERTANQLGVPVGTKSSAAFEAAENRKLNLQMHRESLATQERAQKSANLNSLMGLWRMTGEAPSGLEEFGINPGQSLYQTPTEQLQNILVMTEIAEIKRQEAISDMIPLLSSQFNTNDTTSQAIALVWEYDNKDSAMADYRKYLKEFKEQGVDNKKVLEAINFKFNQPQYNVEKPINPLNVDVSKMSHRDYEKLRIDK